MAAKEKKTEAEEEPKESAEGEAAEGEGEGGKVKGKRKLLFIIIGVVLLAGVGAGLFFSGVLGGGKADKKDEKADKKTEAEAEAVAKPTYYELPTFTVNLSTGTGKTSFLKMTVTLELKSVESKPIMEANKPRVLDTFNTYLRELRPTDLSGSAGIYRLREELIRRVNATVEEGIVKDILFSEIVIQ